MSREHDLVGRCAVAAVGMALASAGVARAAGVVPTPGTPLTVTASFTLDHTSGAADTAGLDGATVTETFTFNAGQTWLNATGGDRFAQASTHTIFIAGASQPQSNGTRWDPDGAGLLYTPGVEGLWIDNLFNNDYPTVSGLAGGADFSLGTSLAPASTGMEPVAGGGIRREQFGGLRADAFSFFYTSDGAMYAIDPTKPVSLNAVGGPTVAVPEPATLSAIGGLALLVLRRRSK